MKSHAEQVSFPVIEKAAREWGGYYAPRWSLPGIVNARLKKKLAAWAGRTLPHGSRILDIGCARGDMLNLLSQSRPDFDLMGVDLSSTMVEIARERFPHINFSQGDGTHLPFDDGSFDLVVNLDTLSMLDPDHTAPALIEEAMRLSRQWVAIEIKVPWILYVQLAIRESLVKIPGARRTARFLFAAVPESVKPECHVHRPKKVLKDRQVLCRLAPWPFLPPARIHILRAS